ncbi:hypothetical protein TNIN_497381, partial [Trichonephila inaurata madagascariensis]
TPLRQRCPRGEMVPQSNKSSSTRGIKKEAERTGPLVSGELSLELLTHEDRSKLDNRPQP